MWDHLLRKKKDWRQSNIEQVPPVLFKIFVNTLHVSTIICVIKKTIH